MLKSRTNNDSPSATSKAVRLISAADFLRKLRIKFAMKTVPHDVSECNETAVFKITNFNYIF